MSHSSARIMTVLLSLLVPSLPSSQPALTYMMSPANTVSCREKDKKLLEEVESAQLAAHRYVEDRVSHEVTNFYLFVTN